MIRHIFQVTIFVDSDEEFSDIQFKNIQKVLDDSVNWMLKEIDTCSDSVQECLDTDLLGMGILK